MYVSVSFSFFLEQLFVICMQTKNFWFDLDFHTVSQGLEAKQSHIEKFLGLDGPDQHETLWRSGVLRSGTFKAYAHS